MNQPVIAPIGPDQAGELHRVVQAAFSRRPPLDPPADALQQSEAELAKALTHGGLIARVAGVAVGGLVFDPAGDLLFIRRFGVDPDYQGHGVAHLMVTAALPFAAGYTALAVLARQELPRNIGFWNDVGFSEVARTPPYVQMHRPVAGEWVVTDAEQMRDLGARIGATLRPGDLVVLSGELGAGKTTFTQGLAEGLGVRGPITSPTFVIARVHPSLVAGPDLVHVDAYRLGGLAELDDLDLDASLDRSVTVVEWGQGLAEQLSQTRIEIRIDRTLGLEAPTDPGTGDGGDAGGEAGGETGSDLDPRRVSMRRM